MDGWDELDTTAWQVITADSRGVILAALIAGKKLILAGLVAAGASAKKLFARKKLAPPSELPPASGSV